MLSSETCTYSALYTSSRKRWRCDSLWTKASRITGYPIGLMLPPCMDACTTTSIVRTHWRSHILFDHHVLEFWLLSLSA
jgi:hypothetical protein